MSLVPGCLANEAIKQAQDLRCFAGARHTPSLKEDGHFTPEVG